MTIETIRDKIKRFIALREEYNHFCEIYDDRTIDCVIKKYNPSEEFIDKCIDYVKTRDSNHVQSCNGIYFLSTILAEETVTWLGSEYAAEELDRLLVLNYKSKRFNTKQIPFELARKLI